MNKLVIISGVTGVGKTTLAEALYNKYSNSIHLSVDSIKEWVNDKIPYNSYEESLDNKELSNKIFIDCLTVSMNKSIEIIIVEHPFRESWGSIFDSLCSKYKYKCIVINVYGTEFKEVWENLDKRNLSKERHLSHSRCNSYNVRSKDNYKPTNEVPYFKVKYDYLSGACTCLKGDRVYSYINDYTLSGLELFLDSLKL